MMYLVLDSMKKGNEVIAELAADPKTKIGTQRPWLQAFNMGAVYGSDKILAQIKAAGIGAYDGSLFRATVSEVADRESLDPKAMEAKLRELGVDGRWFTRNTKTTKGYVTVKVTARKSN